MGDLSDLLSSKADGTIEIELRPDGVYATVTAPIGKGKKVDYFEMTKAIDENGILDCNTAAVYQLINSPDKKTTLKISTNTTLNVVDESCLIEVAKDKMSASITFLPPKNNGKPVSKSKINDALTEKSVVYGIDDLLINDLLRSRTAKHPYVIANGTPPVNGKNGELIYHFNKDKKISRPKETDYGRVDYRELDLIELARSGQKLVTMVLPTEGTPGKNVLGSDISFAKGKPVRMPTGKNTRLSEDGLVLYANIDGQIIFSEAKLSVLPVIEIPGNVDNTTGNINFLGIVKIKGNVVSGFTVTATGNVEVNGVVEGATIKSDEDIILASGVQGSGRGKLVAGGSIKAKFIENCTVNAAKDITADAIMHSDIKCIGKLTVEGRKGLLVGGRIKAGEGITAKVIGSHMATVTELEVGVDPEIFERYNQNKREITSLKAEIGRMDQIINNMMKLKEANQLNDAKKGILIKTIRTKSFAIDKIKTLQADVDSIMPMLQKSTGMIKAQVIIHPGVKVMIGNSIMYIREELKYCKLYNDAGEIKFGPFA